MSKTREDYLIRAVRQLGVLIQRKTGEKIPNEIRVSVGFPSRSVRKTIGQCWHPDSAADGVPQVFISPLLDDPVEVLAVLAHELLHAVNHAAGQKGHGAPFAALAKPLGLEGKMTATVPGETLKAELKLVADKLGEYPHKALDLGSLAPKQSTRMLKLMAPCCEYTVRTTQKWLEVGVPSCPCGTEMQRA